MSDLTATTFGIAISLSLRSINEYIGIELHFGSIFGSVFCKLQLMQLCNLFSIIAPVRVFASLPSG